ncbi:MAG: type II toxin-antitoxin system HicB family antitoxin [Thermoguttaceae bacterium]|nr:type II toxin-antitoxin system HicB family antitoxin [Thermoguttaceae bacterium]MDW8078723.1 toxin-antitoxin system HicB family antitoxin [Thermoguttaceae bacterium]
MTLEQERRAIGAYAAPDSSESLDADLGPAGETSSESVMVEEPAAVDPEATRQILAAARKLYEERCSWAKFYQQILGTNGLIHRLFPTAESQTAFRRSKAYGEIQRMLAALSGRRLRRRRTEQPIKIITVRVPESVHAELAREAALKGLSVNQLCVIKLVQLIEAEALAAGNPPPLTEASSSAEPPTSTSHPNESQAGAS